MNSGIYIIKNIIDCKCYIGKSINLIKRLNDHKQLLHNQKHYNLHLQNAWNLHKETNFIFKILLYCDEKDLSYFENFYCNFFKSHNRKKGYNIEPIILTSKVKRNVETLEKMKKIRLGIKHSEETKKKMSKSQRGKILSKETKNKISNAFKIPLIVMDLNNNVLYEFNSIYDAGMFLNIKPAYISERLRTKTKRYKKFIFVRKREYNPNKDYTLKKDFKYLYKKIVSIDKENKVNIFNSIKEAAITHNTLSKLITRVLTNKRNHDKGIKFMYWEKYKEAFENNGILDLNINYE